MCTLPSDPFVEPFYSLKKAFTRLLPPTPQSADCASINIARPSSAPPILMTPSSAIRAANIPMPVTSKILLNLSVLKWTLIAYWIKFPGDRAHVSRGERSQQVLPISTGLDSPKTPISPPISSGLNAEAMPASQYSYKYTSGLLKCDRPCKVLNKCTSWHYTKYEYRA